MHRVKQMSERSFLRLFFFLFSSFFLIAAFCMPDRADMIPGLLRIIKNPTLSSTNAFSIGGYAATFLNMGLLGLICSVLYSIPGDKPNHDKRADSREKAYPEFRPLICLEIDPKQRRALIERGAVYCPGVFVDRIDDTDQGNSFAVGLCQLPYYVS